MEMVRPKKKWDVKEVLVLFKKILAYTCITAILLVQYIFFAVFYQRIADQLNTLNSDFIELKKIVQMRIKIDRGDYGWDDPSMAPNIEDVLQDPKGLQKLASIDWETGNRMREQINNFAK